MNRRQLLSSTAVLGTLPLAGCGETSVGAAPGVDVEFVSGSSLPWVNWAANQACQPVDRLAPVSEQALVDMLANTTGALRPVGAGHSFSALVPSDGTLVAMDMLNGVISVDAESGLAEIWAGTRLHQLGPELARFGRSLPNLPDIDYQTLAGACATSTHGTGAAFGSLSSYVRALTLALPNGELVRCDESHRPNLFHAARCGLGAFGIVTRVTMQTLPETILTQRAGVENLDALLENIEHEKATNRHVEFLAFPHTRLALVTRTNVAGSDADRRLTSDEDPLAVYQLRDAYRQIGGLPFVGGWLYEKALASTAESTSSVRTGPAWEVLTHDRAVRFREMEYSVPAEAGPACLRAVLEHIDANDIPVVFPIEYRYIKRDDAWLSMYSQRDGCAISVHQYADEDYRPYFAEIEPIFRRFDGRPHWGKLHTLSAPDLSGLYPRWSDATSLRAGVDPDGRLLNAHLRALFGAE